jgi:hypothetical protein
MAEDRFHFAYNRYSFKNKLKTEKETCLVVDARTMIASLQSIYERDDIAFLLCFTNECDYDVFFPHFSPPYYCLFNE